MSLTFHFFLLPNSKIQQETRNWEKVCVRERNVDFPLVLPNLWCVAVKTIFSNNNNNRNTYFKAINYFIIIIDANKTNYVFLEFSFDNIIYLFAIYDYIYENCSAHFFFSLLASKMKIAGFSCFVPNFPIDIMRFSPVLIEIYRYKWYAMGVIFWEKKMTLNSLKLYVEWKIGLN